MFLLFTIILNLFTDSCVRISLMLPSTMQQIAYAQLLPNYRWPTVEIRDSWRIWKRNSSSSQHVSKIFSMECPIPKCTSWLPLAMLSHSISRLWTPLCHLMHWSVLNCRRICTFSTNICASIQRRTQSSVAKQLSPRALHLLRVLSIVASTRVMRPSSRGLSFICYPIYFKNYNHKKS